MDVAARIAALDRLPVRVVRARLRLGDPASLRSLGLTRPPTPADVEQAERDFKRVH